MLFKSYRPIFYAAALLSVANAQKTSKIVPSDLSADFSASDTELQVSYTNDAVNGFTDGTTFDKNGKPHRCTCHDFRLM